MATIGPERKTLDGARRVQAEYDRDYVCTRMAAAGWPLDRVSDVLKSLTQNPSSYGDLWGVADALTDVLREGRMHDKTLN